MSLLSSFLTSHLIPTLESIFVAHEPEMQAELLGELTVVSNQVRGWINGKIAANTSTDVLNG